jgi:pantothenate kinase type III
LFDARMGPGKDTQTCVEHALRLGHVGLIKEAISRVEQAHGALDEIHISGGNAKWLAPLIERRVQLHSHLVLDGLKKVLP